MIELTAKEYLKRIKSIDISIAQRKKEASRLEQDRILLSGIRYDSERVDSSSDGQGFTRLSDKLVDLQKEITELIHNLSKERHRIINEIQHMKNPTYSQILFKKYVEYKDLDDIALEMDYSYDRIRHVHLAALKEFQDEFLKVDTQ